MKADTALLDDVRRMNGDALTRIFDLYAPAIYWYALCLCNDAVMADHIVGDVFTKLLEHLSAGNGPRSNLRSYLFEMAYHVLVDEVRYSYRRVPIDEVEFTLRAGYSTPVSVEKQILLETVSQAIQNDLTEDQRHVIILRFLEGFSLNETASIMGKKAGAVKVMQHRAIAALRKSLDYPLAETYIV